MTQLLKMEVSGKDSSPDLPTHLAGWKEDADTCGVVKRLSLRTKSLGNQKNTKDRKRDNKIQ